MREALIGFEYLCPQVEPRSASAPTNALSGGFDSSCMSTGAGVGASACVSHDAQGLAQQDAAQGYRFFVPPLKNSGLMLSSVAAAKARTSYDAFQSRHVIVQ